MSEDKHHIDQLFRNKLNNKETLPPEEIWESIDAAMPKSLFFRFRYEHMNIYYCSLLVFCFLFSTVSMVYTLHHVNTHEAGMPAQLPADTIYKEKKEYHSAQNKEGGLSPKTANDPGLVRNGFAPTSLSKAVSIKDTVQKTLLSSDDTLVQNKDQQEIKKPDKPHEHSAKKVRKVVYVTDYDTVVNYDTLRTRKKR